MITIPDAISGFALGLSLIIAIGAQNVFVLQQGIRQSHVFAVCLTSAASDALLIAFGVSGFHYLGEATTWLEPLLTKAGAIFLFLYGLLSAKRAIWPDDPEKIGPGESQTLSVAVLTALAFTWLNPHVYLDTVVLLGAVSSQYASPFAFGVGAVLASFVFFFSLGYGARRIAHLFESAFAWRILDSCVTVVMWILAYSLIAK